MQEENKTSSSKCPLQLQLTALFYYWQEFIIWWVLLLSEVRRNTNPLWNHVAIWQYYKQRIWTKGIIFSFSNSLFCWGWWWGQCHIFSNSYANPFPLFWKRSWTYMPGLKKGFIWNNRSITETKSETVTVSIYQKILKRFLKSYLNCILSVTLVWKVALYLIHTSTGLLYLSNNR